MAIDATVIAEATVAASVVVGYIGFLGSRRNSQESTTKDLLINEEKRRDECERVLRELAEKHYAALESVRSERDRERQRADLLAVELQQHKSGSIGGMEKRT